MLFRPTSSSTKPERTTKLSVRSTTRSRPASRSTSPKGSTTASGAARAATSGAGRPRTADRTHPRNPRRERSHEDARDGRRRGDGVQFGIGHRQRAALAIDPEVSDLSEEEIALAAAGTQTRDPKVRKPARKRAA